MLQAPADYNRYCPGEEHIRISDAVCYGRRRVGFPKCKGCQFNDDERAARESQRIIAPGIVVKEAPPEMIDQVFKAYDVRGVYPAPLNEDLAWRIGFAAGTYLRGMLRGVDRSDPDMSRVVVGRDMRKSSPSMSTALIAGLRASRAGVLDIGMIDTPQIYFAVNHLKCCGGVQTTASHNPAEYIGFKISGPGGKPVGADTGLNDIKLIAKNTKPHEPKQLAAVESVDLEVPYRAFVLGFLKLSRPLKVVVDASNGMAGVWLPKVLGGAGGLQVDPLNFEHDGEFVHDPNPLVPANLVQLRRRVLEVKAALGVCFDGDADRCILVDERAEIIGCDLVTALLSKYFLDIHPGAAIVYDLRSSRVVPETIELAGGVPYRERVGHAFMKKALAASQAVFGGELSGHFYFKSNWYCDSGLLAFVHLMNILSASPRPFSELIAPLRRYCSSGERNFINSQQDVTIRRLGHHYSAAKVDLLDGVTVQFPEWWFNVRKSNTEPLLRLNLEADSAALLEEKLAEVSKELGEPADE